MVEFPVKLFLADPVPDPEEIYPGKKPVNGQPHEMEVDSEGDGFIVHTHDCLDRFGDAGCDVSYAQDWVGDGELVEGLVPGEYWIRFWFENPGEDAEFGLELMYPEEAS